MILPLNSLQNTGRERTLVFVVKDGKVEVLAKSRATMTKDDATTKHLRPAPMLFDLPEYDWAFAKFVKRAVDELMIRKVGHHDGL